MSPKIKAALSTVALVSSAAAVVIGGVAREVIACVVGAILVAVILAMIYTAFLSYFDPPKRDPETRS